MTKSYKVDDLITRADVEALNKALSAGYDHIDPVSRKLLDTFGRLDLPKPKLMKSYGAPLQVESLEAILKTESFSLRDLKLYGNIGRKK